MQLVLRNICSENRYKDKQIKLKQSQNPTTSTTTEINNSNRVSNYDHVLTDAFNENKENENIVKDNIDSNDDDDEAFINDYIIKNYPFGSTLSELNSANRTIFGEDFNS